MLIVLDNCAHVVVTAAQIATEVLKVAPDVKIMATSREPLRIDGEHVYRLGPLEYPREGTSINTKEALGFSAMQLFVEQAAAEIEGYALTNDDAPQVAKICRDLDGIPFAIELAAARMAAFGLPCLLSSATSSYQALTNGRRTALRKQRSLNATLDWSYGLLSEREQKVFRNLAIFASGFTLQEVMIIACDEAQEPAEIPDLLAALVSKSLVMADTLAREPDFYLLATTRAYAAAKLTESGELDSVRKRHTGLFRKRRGSEITTS
jgi:predicted ATPase